MVEAAIAEDGNTYEWKSIVEWLKTHNTSPLDPSCTISVRGLRPNRAVMTTIEELVESGDLGAEAKENWIARKKVVGMERAQRMFAEGRILDAAKLGHPKAMGVMAAKYSKYESSDEVKNYDKAFDYATRQELLRKGTHTE